MVMVLCALILCGGVLMGVSKVFGFAGYRYDDAEKYTAGNAEISGNVKNLDIDWTSGKVSFEYNSGNTFVLSETSNQKIEPDRQMRWRLDGDTLRIRYAKSGWSSLFRTDSKDLTVTLPEGTVFENADVAIVSGAIDIPSLKADSISLSAVSGDISAAAEARRINCSTVSGGTELQAGGDTEELSVSSVSGKVNASAEKAGTVHAKSTSGSVQVSVRSFEELKVSAVSGSVTAVLPSVPGFTAQAETVSGHISYELPLTKQGSHYICGDGSGKVSLETVSGNIGISEMA